MKKPAGYWRKFSNLKAELEPLIKKYKRLPSHRELKAIGLESLSRNGIIFHGGAIVVAKKLNVQTYDQSIDRVSANFWTFKNTVKEIIKFVSENDLSYFPTKKQLKDNNRQDLMGAIAKFTHSKFVKVNSIKVKRKKVGNKTKFVEPPRKKIWTEEKTIEELKKVVDNLGYFPMDQKLDAIGRSDLRGAIARQGGHLEFYDKLGKPKRLNPKYQYRRKKRTPNQVIKDYKFLYKKLDHPPSFTELQFLNKYDLLFDIKLHFGTVIKLCEYIGFKENIFGMFKTRSGILVRSINEAILSNIMTYLKIPFNYEGIINSKNGKNYKYDFKTKNLNDENIYIELWGYSKLRKSEKGIFRKVIKDYQSKKRRKIALYKKSQLKLIEIEGEEIQKSITNAYYKVSKKFLENNLIKKIPKIKSFDTINFLVYKLYDIDLFKKDLKKIVNEFGYLPSNSKLYQRGYKAIASRISKFGGYPLIRKKFNFK